MKRLALTLLALLLLARPALAQELDASAIHASDDLTIDADALMPASAGQGIGTLIKPWGSLHVTELVTQMLVAQDTMATIGGRLLVSPTTTLVQDLDDDDTTIHVKQNDLLDGDPIVLEANGQIEHMTVTSSASGSAGDYSYSVTRNADGSGANSWTTGDAVVDTKHGYIDLYSVSGLIPGDTEGPTIAFDARTGTDWDDIEPRAVIGNLDGTYGYSSTTFGAAFGDPDAAWLKVDATNGVRIGYGATTKISLDASGNADITGALSAGSITTDKLAVGMGGAALNDDPSTSSIDSWQVITGSTTATIAAITDGKTGTTTLRSASGARSDMRGARAIAVDPTKTYRVHAWARKSSTADGTLFIGVALQDSSGGNITTGSGATYWYVAASNVSGSTTWTEYTGTIGANATTNFPSNARTMRPLTLMNLGGSAGYFEIQDFRVEEVLPGTLIQDGAISTDKLAANSVTAAKIAANTITSSQIASDTITASQIAAGAISTSELAADAVTSAKIAAGTITSSDIAAGTITADRLNVSTLSAITANLGTVTAGTINGVTITGSTLTAGGGSEVFLSDDGITIESGTDDRNAVKWGDGSSKIWGTDTALDLIADNEIVIGCCGIAVTVDRAHSSVNIDGSIFNGALGGTGTRHVCAESTGKIVICP